MSYKGNLKAAGFSYLGSCSQSMKLRLSEKNGVLTFGIYLAPANMSGYEVCPNSKWCREFCLNGSGHNKMEILAGKNRIQRARIKKTRLFFENRELFMVILIHEIKRWRKYAEEHGLRFAIRINCTSDISPEEFVYNGKNILEIFPDVQFYDYTKVYSRINLLGKYKNYDLTYSYSGHNENCCKKFLAKGGKVAVVFASNEMPESFMGYPCTDGNLYDMRYLDPAGHVIFLHYHPVANDYKNGKFVMPDTPFVVKPTDSRISWAS